MAEDYIHSISLSSRVLGRVTTRLIECAPRGLHELHTKKGETDRLRHYIYSVHLVGVLFVCAVACVS